MKRAFLAIACAVSLVLFIGAARAADFSTDLTIAVPKQYGITFLVTGGGSISVERAESAFAVTDSKKIVVKENEPLIIRFNPDEGFRAASVLLGTAELAGQIKDGLLTTPGFTKEETVTVTFTETAAQPSNRPSTPAVPDPPQGGGKPVGTGAASAVLLFPCMLASGCIVFFCRKERDGTDTFS